MFTATLAVFALSLPIQSEAPDLAGPAPLRVESWLVIDDLDGRGRRPLRPDAVFATHLLDGAEAEPPVAGQRLTGERGTAAWEFADVADSGGPDAPSSYAYGTLEVAPEDAGVYLGQLSGAWQFFVNGRPHVGDAYRYGFGGVPVELVAGTNHIYVTGARGNFGLDFTRPESEVVIEERDLTLPDVVADDSTPISIGFAVHRTSAERLVGARVEVESRRFEGQATLAGLAGLETRVVSLNLRPTNAALLQAVDPEGSDLPVDSLRLLDRAGVELARCRIDLGPVPPERGKFLRSFRSSIDGSTQVYGEVAPVDSEEDELPGLVLSLHGASVKPRNQIGAYGNYPGLWIVAPTNRRPFGFDWQDWGRLDAYEVRDTFVSRNAVSPTRRYLTGHSMGGHGTWHLAANDPDQWAVVAPSAGWRSFDTYGSRPAGALREWWHRADAASHTESAIANLRQLPTFILHGDADETVPVSEAEAMLELLESNDAVDVRSHFEPGAGHWWDGDPAPGAACVQWPQMFAMFGEYRLSRAGEDGPPGPSPPAVEFRTVDPAVDGRHHWVEVLEARTIGQPSRVSARSTAQVPQSLEGALDQGIITINGTIVVETENVGRLRLHAERPFGGLVEIDGIEIELGGEDPLQFRFSGGGWRLDAAPVRPERRRPDRSGPFKRAFDREFVLVRGTAGDAAETQAQLDLSRYHAAEWWYRANGRTLLLTDEEFVARPDLAHNNVILYGNAETNTAWSTVFEGDCPLIPRRGGVAFAGDFLRGADRAAQFVHRRSGSDLALAGAFAAASPRGTRLHLTTAPFVSGVGIPDYLIFDSSVLSMGDDGAVVTGFWDHEWEYDPSNQAGF